MVGSVSANSCYLRKTFVDSLITKMCKMCFTGKKIVISIMHIKSMTRWYLLNPFFFSDVLQVYWTSVLINHNLQSHFGDYRRMGENPNYPESSWLGKVSLLYKKYLK